MNIVDKTFDFIIKKTTGKETFRVEPEQLLQIVKDEFIFNADNETLKVLFRMSKGPFWGKKLISQNGRYLFVIGGLQRGCALGIGRSVWIEDLEKKSFYQIYDRKWRKFKKMLIATLNEEQILRR